jgi:hypothetical protein
MEDDAVSFENERPYSWGIRGSTYRKTFDRGTEIEKSFDLKTQR